MKAWLFQGVFVGILTCLGCAGGKVAPESNSGKLGIEGQWSGEEFVVWMDWASGKSNPVKMNPKENTQTVFEPQGSFKETRLSAADGTIKAQQSGYWHQYGDSLYLHYAQEGARRQAFHIKTERERLKLEWMGDFDGDGLQDDKLQLRMIKR